jgi:hypothetical protein
MKSQCMPEEYVGELNRQTEEAAGLVQGVDLAALNWQPNGRKSWSVGQCLDHLVRTNTVVLAAMRAAVEGNRDQLETRCAPLQPAGWFSRWFIGFIGPDSTRKVSAPSKIVPASQVSPDVLADFAAIQQSIAAFVSEFKDTDLGGIRYRNPLAPIRWTVDSGLLIFLAHNQRHLHQAERVKQSAGFPR